MDCFISDSFYGTYLLTEYLLDRGHRDIAFVRTPYATNSITDRFFGFQKAISVDLQAMAKAAVKSLIRQMNGENVKGGIHVVEGRLVVKNSVRKLT